MAKKIYTVLKLKDEFSKPLMVAAKGTKAFENQARYATGTIKNFANNLNGGLKKAVTNSVKYTAMIGGAIGALGVKAGLSEAMNLEGYKLQLETATKDTKKAADIMRYSVQLANKTPFEGGELVEGAAKLEAMGMSAKSWLPKIGDMAAGTNKSFDQAVEAVIDAQTGELERLKEFGITKAKIAEKADKMFAGQQVVNNKGQIIDQQKFNEALVDIMEDRFAGGMEKQSNSLKGLWSTVTGVTKSALATIMGITEDGTVKEGSLYDMLKDKIRSVADTLTAWQQNGTLEAISETVTSVVTSAIDGLSTAFTFLKDNMFWILPVATGLVSAFLAFNIIMGIVGMINAFRTATNLAKIAMALFNVTMLANPLIWIPAVIAAAVAAGIALWKNWDKVKQMAEKLKDKVLGLVDAIKGFFGFGDKKVNLEVNTKRTETTTGGKGGGGKGKEPPTPKHALGTPYFAGGKTEINEGGRKEMAVLPSGTQIVPADKTRKALGGSPVNFVINLVVQGNLIGDETYANFIGQTIVGKVKLAMQNM